MANKYKGEVVIKIGEQEFVLKPSYEAIATIEETTGKSLPALMDMFSTDGGAYLKDVVAVIWGGVVGSMGDKAPSLSEIGELVVEHGIMQLVANQELDDNPVAQFMVKCLRGNKALDELSPKADDKGEDDGKKPT